MGESNALLRSGPSGNGLLYRPVGGAMYRRPVGGAMYELLDEETPGGAGGENRVEE